MLRAAGIVAIGAALLHEITTDGEPVVFTHAPRKPVRLLAVPLLRGAA